MQISFLPSILSNLTLNMCIEMRFQENEHGKNAHLNSILRSYVHIVENSPFFEGLIQIIAICFDFHARLHFEEEPLLLLPQNNLYVDFQ